MDFETCSVRSHQVGALSRACTVLNAALTRDILQDARHPRSLPT